MDTTIKMTGFNAISDAFPKFAEGIRKLDAPFKKSLDILADHGWYISKATTLGDIFENTKAAIQKDTSKIDKAMTKLFKSEQKSIHKKLIANHPDRKNILNEAFNCHSKKYYHASITLFLSQADGIMAGKLYLIKNDKAALKNYLSTAQYTDYIKEVLTKVRGIDCFTDDISKHNSDLNRHAMMHGLTSDFGNEVNSYKAMSLLNFVEDFKK
jgi:hypothetical protein